MVFFSNLTQILKFKRNYKLGFTVVELTVAMSIVVVISAMVFAAPKDFFNNKTLDSVSNEVVSVLSKARSFTLASKNESSYGVHFETNFATFFIGQTFASSTPSNEIIEFGDKIAISQISLGGSSDVVFERLSGRALSNGFIIFSQVTGQLKSKTINIYESGLVQ